MRLQNFLLADAASAGPDGKMFIHGGGVASLAAQSFPWTQPQLSVFLTLQREEEPAGSDHELRVEFQRPQGEALEAAIETNLRIPADAAPSAPMYINLIATFTGVEFPAPGLYWVRSLFDGTEVGRVPLQVGGPRPVLEVLPTDGPSDEDP